MVDDDTASRIRSAAFELFSQRGFDGTSMRDVSKKVGVSVGVVTYHYKKKETLYRAAIEPAYEEFTRQIRTIVQSDETSAQRLKALMSMLAHARGDQLRLLRLFVRQILSGAAPLAPMIPMFVTGHVPPVMRLMMECVRDGVVDVRYVPGIAPLLIGGLAFSAMFADGVAGMPIIGQLAPGMPEQTLRTMCLMLGIDE